MAEVDGCGGLPIFVVEVLLEHRCRGCARWAACCGGQGLSATPALAPDALALAFEGHFILCWVVGCGAVDLKGPKLAGIAWVL